MNELVGLISFFKKWNRGHRGIFLLISLFCLVLIVYAGFKIQEARETRVLVIEDLRTGRTLWQSQIKEGDEILYEYIHSVYRDKVYQHYEVSPSGSLILVKVVSSHRVLFSSYPGFAVPPSPEERVGELVGVKMNRQLDNLGIAVGDELTDKRLTVGQQSMNLIQLAGEGSAIMVYVIKATRR